VTITDHAADLSGAHAELRLALLGPRAAGGPRRSVKMLLQSGRRALSVQIQQLPEAEQAEAESLAISLAADGVRALLCDDPRYPERLRSFPGSPPALFCRGDVALLGDPAIGVCGSRNATTEGLSAARACGEDAARSRVTVVSGYAKGVDTESHTAAIKAGGRTIAVLAEGISHFKVCCVPSLPRRSTVDPGETGTRPAFDRAPQVAAPSMPLNSLWSRARQAGLRGALPKKWCGRTILVVAFRV
jgi:hypothetical protein